MAFTMNRRDFLRTSALASCALYIPRFLHNAAGAAYNGRVLVVLQLSGGNDGLNTVVPFGNDLYYKARPDIAIAKSEVLRLTEMQGLHPALTGLRSLYDDGALAILNSVGYPNPDRSHFRSMDIWHTASDADQYWNNGWIGRYLDAECETCKLPLAAIEADDSLSLAMRGARRSGFGVTDPDRLYKSTQTGVSAGVSKLAKELAPTLPPNSNLAFLYKNTIQAFESAQTIYETNQTAPAAGDYPKGELGNHLRTTASLILGGLSTSVYYVSIAGFDTHINQKNRQNDLLTQVGNGLQAFAADLKKGNRWNDVLVMVFSEFGRRVEQNASAGTDHGAANNVWLLGGNLHKPGIYNSAPNLAALNDGDLQHEIDFRRVYATVLDKWLHADADTILGKPFDRLSIL
jgi:uncharacterized protein (DUF1501 family)